VQAGSVSAQIVLQIEAGLTTNTKPKQQKRGKKKSSSKKTRQSSNSPAMAVFLSMELDARREGYSSEERARDKACESAERDEAVSWYLLLPRLIRRLVCLHPAVADITQMFTGTIR